MNLICEGKNFVDQLKYLIINYQIHEFKRFFKEHQEKSYETLNIDIIPIFQMIGQKDYSIQNKHLLMKELLICLDEYCDVSYTNLAVIESLINERSIDEQFIKLYSKIDTFVQELPLVEWLFIKNKIEILDWYLKVFNDEIPWILKVLDAYRRDQPKLIKYINDAYIPKKSALNGNFEQLELYSEYGVSSIIHNNDIIKLRINNLEIEQFIISNQSYIDQIELLTKHNLQAEPAIFESFNDIVSVTIVTDEEKRMYDIKPFFETSFGINHLQRYTFDNHGRFVYDFNAIKLTRFKNPNLEIVLKSKLNVPLNEPLNHQQLKKIQNLSCIIDERFNLYEINDIIQVIPLMTMLRHLEILYEHSIDKMLINVDEIAKMGVLDTVSIHINHMQFNFIFDKSNFSIKTVTTGELKNEGLKFRKNDIL